MESHGSCPTDKTWGEYLSDRIGQFERLRLRDHLMGCLACRRRLTLLEPTERKRSPDEETGAWSETAVVSTLAEAVATEPAPDQLAPEDADALGCLQPSNMPGSLGRIAEYEVQSILGRGGMGIVFKAFDSTLHRMVAIKVLAPRLASSARARKRFAQEARAAAAINHPNVVTIHAVDAQEGMPFLVMEYIPGISLRERIRQGPTLKPGEILRISLQIANGLEAAHHQVVIHRDIKPANVMLEDNLQRVKITDFGLAQAAMISEDLTSSDHLVGTPEYMSPEQVRGETLDARSDLFSLGTVMYAMVAGQSPFKGTHMLDTVRRVSDLEPPPLQTINPKLPRALSDLVGRLLKKDRCQRPATAADVADTLRSQLTDARLFDSAEQGAVFAQDDCEAQRRKTRRLLSRIGIAALLLIACLIALRNGKWALSSGNPVLSSGVIFSGRTVPSGQAVTVGRGTNTHYQRLSDALYAVGPGSTMKILAAPADEGPWEIKDPLRLEGLTIEGSPGVALTAPGKLNAIFTIVGVPSVTVRELAFQSGPDQFALSLGGLLPDLKIQRCRFLKPEGTAGAWEHVWLGNAGMGKKDGPIHFEDCDFGAWDTALTINGHRGGMISHVLVERCCFSTTWRGVAMFHKASDITIRDCMFLGMREPILMDELGEPSGKLTIEGNRFFRAGVWIRNIKEWRSIPDVTVKENLILESPRIDGEHGELAKAAQEGWSFRDNYWETTEPIETPLAIAIKEAEVISRVSTDPDFLRPAPGSALAGLPSFRRQREALKTEKSDERSNSGSIDK